MRRIRVIVLLLLLREDAPIIGKVQYSASYMQRWYDTFVARGIYLLFNVI